MLYSYYFGWNSKINRCGSIEVENKVMSLPKIGRIFKIGIANWEFLWLKLNYEHLTTLIFLAHFRFKNVLLKSDHPILYAI